MTTQLEHAADTYILYSAHAEGAGVDVVLHRQSDIGNPTRRFTMTPEEARELLSQFPIGSEVKVRNTVFGDPKPPKRKPEPAPGFVFDMYALTLKLEGDDLRATWTPRDCSPAQLKEICAGRLNVRITRA
jgi:hypothetical protein